jgi:hypothetical protein
MTTFLKVSEAPKTKFQLKKAILEGSIIVFEKNNHSGNSYRKLDKVKSILTLWEGFQYAPKYQGQLNEASAVLGTSFYYKFQKATKKNEAKLSKRLSSRKKV